MNLLLALLLTILCHASPRPADDRNLGYVTSVARTHFGKKEDYKDVNLPSGEVSRNGQPYNYNLTNNGSGNYYFRFHTFGLQRYEVGELKNAGTENEIQVIRGQYTDRYVNKYGVHVIRTIGYIADENGYRPFLIGISFSLSAAPHAPPPGGPRGETKTDISSAALGSLIGGNTFG